MVGLIHSFFNLILTAITQQPNRINKILAPSNPPISAQKLSNTPACHLASLALPTFILNGKYDFKKFYAVTKSVKLQP